MTIYKRLAAALATIAMVLVGSLAFTSPAQASSAQVLAAPGSCANNSVCGYGRNNYRTDEGYEFVTGAAGTCQNVGLNDQWTSVYNNAGRTVRLYRDANCGNGVWTLGSGSGLFDMQNFQPSWNDKISSVRMSG